MGFARYNQFPFQACCSFWKNSPDNEATQRCQKTTKYLFPPLSADSKEMKKKVLDEIAVAKSTDIHYSPYGRRGVTKEG
jgi:hypothetical protein